MLPACRFREKIEIPQLRALERLLQECESRGALLRALYYTTIIKDQKYSAVRLIDWLDYMGYTVVSKPAKEFDDGGGRRKVKRSKSIELVVDALELSDHIDHIVRFSGTAICARWSKQVQRRGVHVTVVSTLSMIADELRRRADVFTDLVELKSKIGRSFPREPRHGR